MAILKQTILCKSVIDNQYEFNQQLSQDFICSTWI